MANEVAKISVGIEAKVDGLAADMKNAENVVRNGAKNIEDSVKNASIGIQNSWMEAFAKVSMITTVLKAVENSMKALTAVVKINRDETLNSSQKIVGSIKAIEEGNIFLISSLVSTGNELGKLFDDNPWLKWISPIAHVRDFIAGLGGEIEGVAGKIDAGKIIAKKAYLEQRDQIAENIELSKEQLSLLEHGIQVAEAKTQEEKVFLETERERLKLLDDLAAKEDENTKTNRTAMGELIAANDAVYDAFLASQDLKVAAAKKTDDDIVTADQERADRELEIATKLADRETEIKTRKDAAIISSTKDVESKILQLQLEAIGKSEEAEQEAIRRSFEKRINAAETAAQETALIKLMGLEMAATGADPTAAGGGGMTSYNASGVSLRFASGGSPELKESERQTKLQTEMLAELQKTGGGGLGIISPPAA